MTASPSPKQLAAYLHDLADKVLRSGPRALDLAGLLADRGYPTSTAGAGVGGRSSDRTSSVERAVIAGPDRWSDTLRQLQHRHRALWVAALHLEAGIDEVLAHASDADPLPPGTGYCVCRGDDPPKKNPDRQTDTWCATYCSPKQNGPEDRLKSGLAPSCHRRFLRWREDTGQPNGTVAEWRHATRRAREVAADKAQRLANNLASLRS